MGEEEIFAREWQTDDGYPTLPEIWSRIPSLPVGKFDDTPYGNDEIGEGRFRLLVADSGGFCPSEKRQGE